jgi:hypothetical protein
VGAKKRKGTKFIIEADPDKMASLRCFCDGIMEIGMDYVKFIDIDIIKAKERLDEQAD